MVPFTFLKRIRIKAQCIPSWRRTRCPVGLAVHAISRDSPDRTIGGIVESLHNAICIQDGLPQILIGDVIRGVVNFDADVLTPISESCEHSISDLCLLAPREFGERMDSLFSRACEQQKLLCASVLETSPPARHAQRLLWQQE